jgi:histone deacetylase 6
MKTVTTRNDIKEAKIKTRSMTKEKDDTRQNSLKEAKQRGRQKMSNKGNSELESLKDIYSNALSSKLLIRKQTGIIYDDSMGVEHYCLWDQNYPESPERYSSVMNRCRELKLIERCLELTPRLATKDEILMNHTEEHYKLLESTKGIRDNEKLENLSSLYDAIYIHPESFNLSLLACGSTIELVDEIIIGNER